MSVTNTVALYDHLHNAIAQEQPLVVLYNTADSELKARVLFPSRLMTSKDGHDYVKAFDSLRNETRSFRVDRIVSAHHLTA
jgi:predicted DNA-binding transcriptional regulator YafY